MTVRLVNGSTSNEGRVEVYYNGEWGTVCDLEWDINDAEVVCRELGFGRANATRRRGFYGQGRGRIWLDAVFCVGTELTIANCDHIGWHNHYCDHSEDAGVICAGMLTICLILCVHTT